MALTPFLQFEEPGVAAIVTSVANGGNGPREVDIMGRFTF